MKSSANTVATATADHEPKADNGNTVLHEKTDHEKTDHEKTDHEKTDQGKKTNGRRNGRAKVVVEQGSADLAVMLASLQTMRNGDFSVRLPGSW
ncbi:MAG TPA: hypothetical protein VIL63_03010, partial [Terriglobales bacterium]